jgi:hypothetical protein
MNRSGWFEVEALTPQVLALDDKEEDDDLGDIAEDEDDWDEDDWDEDDDDLDDDDDDDDDEDWDEWEDEEDEDDAFGRRRPHHPDWN